MKILFGDLLPGETPIEDMSGLKIPGITTRSELAIAEAANIRPVLVKYFQKRPTADLAPFDLGWICGLHREMYGDVWEWAGQFRSSDLNLGCPWAQVQQRLYDLLEDLEYWKAHTGQSTSEMSARLHHRLVQIHPFLNGNGRWGRVLTNIWLAVNRHSTVEWPEPSMGSVSPIRDEYIQALKSADQGDINQLLQMHQRFAGPDDPWA